MVYLPTFNDLNDKYVGFHGMPVKVTLLNTPSPDNNFRPSGGPFEHKINKIPSKVLGHQKFDQGIHKPLTHLKLNSSPLKSDPSPKTKGSSSNRHFSGENSLLNFGGWNLAVAMVYGRSLVPTMVFNLSKSLPFKITDGP